MSKKQDRLTLGKLYYTVMESEFYHNFPESKKLESERARFQKLTEAIKETLQEELEDNFTELELYAEQRGFMLGFSYATQLLGEALQKEEPC